MSRESGRSDEEPWIVTAYREHFRYIHALVGRLGVPAANVEDTVQEVFLVLYRRRAEFRGESSVRTWLHGIAVFVARRHRDTLRRRAAKLEQIEGSAVGRLDEEVEQRQALRRLDRLLDQLVDEQREVFVLAEVSGFSAPEIAAALGLNINTVYSRLRLARSRLQRALESLRAEEGGQYGAA
ncbi:MAG: RNA polymerase sigma factor [Myxococcales bacterium]|nr:RNA polymerase sigma factor [Myxococcales bacterium]